MTHLYSVHGPIAEATEATLRVTLLGGFAVEHDGRVVPDPAWQRRSARQLTKLLAMEPGHALHREQVMERLWPDADLDSARNSLAKALHAARRVLEPGRAAREGSAVLRTRDEMIVLEAEHVVIDAEEFQQRAWVALRDPTACAFERALTAYGGALLPEDRYEDWTAEPRQHLAELHLRLLRGLAELLDREGAHLQAVECLQRAIQADPTHEEAHRRLMRVYAELGDTGAAVRQFEVCRSALRRDLAVDPASETVALHDELATRLSEEASRDPDGDAGFVGRVEERHRLTGAFERAVTGRGGLVVVTGEAGAGKSRLVAELAREADARGAVVLGPSTHGTTTPLAPFTAALDAYAADSSIAARAGLARRFPALTWFNPAVSTTTLPAFATEDRAMAMHLGTEIARLLQELGGDRTIVVLLGDLDDAHGSSPALLAGLATLAHQRRWLLVGTVCDESLAPGSEASRLLATLSYAQVCTRVSLSPLSPDECRELVDSRDPAHQLDDDTRARICALADGNPRFAEEFVREQLHRQTGATRRWNTAETEAFPIPAMVHSMLERTLSRLDTSARRLVELVACADDDVTFDQLRRAAVGLGVVASDAELFEALDLTLAGGVLAERHDRYAIRHVVMADALRERLPRYRGAAMRAALRDSALDLRLTADIEPSGRITHPVGPRSRAR